MIQMNNNRPARRVGTFSMGVALIAAGICAILSMFLPWLDWVLVLRLSPLLLILLGGEILFYHFFYKEERLVFDVLSMVLCCFLITATFGMMVLYASARFHGLVP